MRTDRIFFQRSAPGQVAYVFSRTCSPPALAFYASAAARGKGRCAGAAPFAQERWWVRVGVFDGGCAATSPGAPPPRPRSRYKGRDCESLRVATTPSRTLARTGAFHQDSCGSPGAAGNHLAAAPVPLAPSHPSWLTSPPSLLRGSPLSLSCLFPAKE